MSDPNTEDYQDVTNLVSRIAPHNGAHEGERRPLNEAYTIQADEVVSDRRIKYYQNCHISIASALEIL